MRKKCERDYEAQNKGQCVYLTKVDERSVVRGRLLPNLVRSVTVL